MVLMLYWFCHFLQAAIHQSILVQIQFQIPYVLNALQLLKMMYHKHAVPSIQGPVSYFLNPNSSKANSLICILRDIIALDGLIP
jgi:hypothetical protein